MQITALKLTINCLQFGFKAEAEEIIENFNFQIKINDKKLIDRDGITQLDQRIKQIQTTLKLNEVQEREERGKEKKTVWEDLIVYIHQTLNISIDYNCSVALFRSYEKQAKAMIKAKNKKNG